MNWLAGFKIGRTTRASTLAPFVEHTIHSQLFQLYSFINLLFCVSFLYLVGQELPYDSQYVTSGTGLFANFTCDYDYYYYDSLYPCDTTTYCHSSPLVVSCSQGNDSLLSEHQIQLEICFDEYFVAHKIY